MTLALATFPSVLIPLLFLLVLGVLAVVDYKRICRRDEERYRREHQPEPEWDFPPRSDFWPDRRIAP